MLAEFRQMQYSTQDIADMIQDGGLDYGLVEHIDPELIEDPTLSDMWGRAGDLLRAIADYTSSEW